MSDWIPPNSQYPPPKPSEPPLHEAARLGDVVAIRRLVSEGADINAAFDIGLDPGAWSYTVTPLMVAAGSGDGATVETVRLLLEHGADASVVIEGRSAATFAASGLGWNYRPGGDAARLRTVLDAGAPLPADKKRANAMLCEAAGRGDAECVAVLVGNGVDPNGFFDADAVRASHRAMREQGVLSSPVELLAGVPEEMRESIEQSMRELQDNLENEMASAPWHAEIPLFCAAASGNTACVEALLIAGADVRKLDISQRTAMFYAGSVEVARRLMRAGLSIEETDQYGWTPLCAALGESEAVHRVGVLIEAGANVNASHDHGYTVFMSAVGSNRRMEVLRQLIAAGANPHAVSERGYNAFHAALDVNFEANAEQSVRETLSFLKQLGVDLEAKNAGGETPLARAINWGNAIEVSVLCELGADPNARCTLRRCGDGACASKEMPLPFHAVEAAVSRHMKTESLLKVGGDPLATDAGGHAPLSYVVARLCSNAPAYDEAFRSFYRGAAQVRIELPVVPTDRSGFIAAVTPALRTFVERFAADMGLDEGSKYAAEWRREDIECAAHLLACEAWARRNKT